jgi:hypothetical protein
MTESPDPSPDSERGLVYRPAGQLHDYPIDVRWEVSRRHPYYLGFWELASRYWRNELSDHSGDEWLGKLAAVMLQTIGIHGEPISPNSDAKALSEGDYDLSFLTGSVQPVTMRAIVTMLLSALPTREQQAVSKLLSMASDDEHRVEKDDESRTLQKYNAQMELLKIPSKALDSTPASPLFLVHLGASLRSIVRDTQSQVRAWKKKRNIGTCKVHTEILTEYLRVWDMREGWMGSGYDRSRELSLAKVTTRLKTGAISTTANRYRSAFQMISGHKFSPELWWRLFGPLQFPELCVDSTAVLSAPLRRRLRSPVPRPAPESMVSPRRKEDESQASGVVECGATARDDVDLRILVMDLEELVDKGLSDEDIADKLELSDPRSVADFRSRIADLRSL